MSKHITKKQALYLAKETVELPWCTDNVSIEYETRVKKGEPLQHTRPTLSVHTGTNRKFSADEINQMILDLMDIYNVTFSKSYYNDYSGSPYVRIFGNPDDWGFSITAYFHVASETDLSVVSGCELIADEPFDSKSGSYSCKVKKS